MESVEVANTSLLRAPLPSAAQRLVDLLAQTFLTYRLWPTYDYVERTLWSESVNAGSSLRVLMEERVVQGGYSLAWTSEGRRYPVPLEAKVGLTVAGMSHSAALVPLAEASARVVRILADDEASLEPKPTAVVTDCTDMEMLTTWLKNAVGRDTVGRYRLEGLPELVVECLVDHEPALWGCWGSPTASGGRQVNLSARLRPYRHVESLDDYLAAIEAVLAPPVLLRPPAAPSPLSLPTALDFLDAVWRNTHDRSPLFGHRSHVSHARLALGCANADELEANLSAFAGVLERMAVPGEEGGTLARLEQHLVSLGLRSERVESATKTLRSIVNLRAKAQHDPNSHAVVRSYSDLHIPYPPVDAELTWNLIVERAVSALDALREELQELRG